VQARCRPYQPFSSGCSISEASNKPPCCVSSHWQLSPENIVQNWQVKNSSQLFSIQKTWETWTVLFLVIKLKSWHLSLLCITLYSSNKACTLLFLAYQVEICSKNHVNKGHQKVTKSGFFGLFSGTSVMFSRTSDWLQVMRKPPWGFKNPVVEVLMRAITTRGEKTTENNMYKDCRITTNKTNSSKNHLDDTRKQWSITPDGTPNWMWSFCHSEDCLTLQQLSNLANANSGALLT